MVFALEVIADTGIIALPFQAIMGAVFSIVFVGLAALLGLGLRISVAARFWYSSVWPAVALLTGVLLIVFFGRSLGLTTTLKLPDRDEAFETLHPLAAYGSMLVAVFSLLHFPPSSQPVSPDDRHA